MAMILSLLNQFCSVLSDAVTLAWGPFLVLAIGVDNVFLLTWAFDQGQSARIAPPPVSMADPLAAFDGMGGSRHTATRGALARLS